MNGIVKQSTLVFVGLMCVALVVPLGCESPADFEVRSLTIRPSEASVGEEVTVTAEVRNNGGTQGTYDAVLTVDGTEVDTTAVAVAADASVTVIFTLVRDASGSYQVGVGEMKAALVVSEEAESEAEEEEAVEEAEPAPEEETSEEPSREYIELKYDDGEADSSKAFGTGPMGYGHVVRFAPAITPFTVDRVKVYGRSYGDGCDAREVEVQVRDLAFSLLDSCRCSHREFTETPDWVTIDMTGVAVEDEFYIVVLTDSPKECGVSVFIDSDSENLHSEYVKGGKLAEWSIEPPQEEVNWMIRVEQGVPPEEAGEGEEGGAAYESLDYFPIAEGRGVKYHVTDEFDGLDCKVWAESQRPEELSGGHFPDFIFTLGIKAGGESNRWGGYVAHSVSGRDLTMFCHGRPVGNQGNFYMSFSLPRFFESGDEWEVVGRNYAVECVGARTVGGAEFEDCIRVELDDSSNELEDLEGTGYFILARDVGIVELVFDRASGDTVSYEYVEHK